MALSDVIAAGGVVVFPSDTVYGLACDPGNEAAIARMYALKGRAPDKPAALMYPSVDAAAAAFPEHEDVLRRLLPGPLTLVLPDGGGLRVPAVALPFDRAVLQTSANHAGGPDARRLDEVPQDIRDGADAVLDGGPLPGTPSTVVDLRGPEPQILREGAVPAADVLRALRPRG